ncbi:MAG TPA: hypothetical protein PK971_05365 [Saprospiraceae bacterium]|nr:hypothetical protein [Saprospiraceae bacterium]HND87732.1 hypothetical protein [Saprospiraceae bacterium]
MNLTQLVEAVDAMIIKGDIISAFDQFAADQCATLSSPQDKTQTKAQKLEALRWFFSNVASVNRIERPAFAVVNDHVTDSQFVFDFTNRQGQDMVFTEVIRRTWANGKIVEELYLMGQNLENTHQPAASKAKASTKTIAKTAAEKPVKTTTAKKSAEPVAAPKAAAKTTKTTIAEPVAPADDLTVIEGIGPKIAELLVAGGIRNFKELAAAKPAAIKTLLEAAGKRYQMHDPATWPKQAALARDGKTAELAKLQGELKAGK